MKPVTGNIDALAEQAAGQGPGVPVPSGRRRLLAIGLWGGCALVALALWAAYVWLSQTFPTDSDGASIALQAGQMLHGNPLLRGWVLADVSFYTTELAVHAGRAGHRAERQRRPRRCGHDVHPCAHRAAVLAAGRVRGWAAVIDACIAAGIMLDPQGADGVLVLLSSPDHTGTSVPIVAAWLILDRTRPSCAAAVAVSLVLGWAEVADALVTYAAIVPLVLVVVIRLADALIRDRKTPGAARWPRAGTRSRSRSAPSRPLSSRTWCSASSPPSAGSSRPGRPRRWPRSATSSGTTCRSSATGCCFCSARTSSITTASSSCCTWSA